MLTLALSLILVASFIAIAGENEQRLSASSEIVKNLISFRSLILAKIELHKIAIQRLEDLDCFLEHQRLDLLANSWISSSRRNFTRHLQLLTKSDFYLAAHMNLTQQSADQVLQGYRNLVGDELLLETYNEPASIKDEDDNEPLTEDEINSRRAAVKLLNSSQYAICRNSEGDNFVNFKYRRLRRPALSCRFDNRNRHPLLVLSPVKEEIVSVEPLIVIFHDLLLPWEMETFKNLTLPELQVALVVNENTSVTEVDMESRVASGAWIGDHQEHKFVLLNRRIEAYTGLTTSNEGAEHYHVVKYNVGGHYVPHLDPLFEAADERGDRFATLLAYMSDVEAGGLTVFTSLGLRIIPQAGSAIFWFNFHKNINTADERTTHAACPVLKGSKWILTKWFRSGAQLLLRPCGSTPEETFSLNDL